MFVWRGVEVSTDTDLMDTMTLLVRAGTPLDAMEFIDDYAQWLKQQGYGDDDPWKLAKENLGYLIGYMPRDEAKETYLFFELVHPLLGPEPWHLTSEEIFKKGIEWGTAINEGRPYP